jgi:hypothetical protein
VNRRTALQLIGTGITAGIAGCSTSLDSTSTPDPPACPEIPAYLEAAELKGNQTVVCNLPDTSDPQNQSLVANPQTTSLPDATVEFTLTNRREAAYTTNFYRWGLYKRVDGQWYSVVRRWVDGGDSTLASGERHSWTFSIDNSTLSKPVEAVRSNGGETTLRGLGGGTYAFLLPGSHEDVSMVINSDNIISYATQFTIDGSPLDLVPTDTVTDVSRTGDTVEVTVGNNNARTEWIITRTTETPPDQTPHERIITEQLYGRPALRSAFAHFDEDIERVVLRTRGGGLIPGGYVTFDGTTYRIENQFVTNE